ISSSTSSTNKSRSPIARLIFCSRNYAPSRLYSSRSRRHQRISLCHFLTLLLSLSHYHSSRLPTSDDGMLSNPGSGVLHGKISHPSSSPFRLSSTHRSAKPSVTPTCSPCIVPRKSSLCSLSLLFPRKQLTQSFARVRSSLEDHQVPDSVAAPFFPQYVSVKIPYGDREILVETGHIGRQASGAVMVTDGETVTSLTWRLSIRLFVWMMFQATLQTFFLCLYIIKNVFLLQVEQVGDFSNEREEQKIMRYTYEK
ncbi:Polyribonucleotide nucleotidyltransferase 1, chloroplastic, partial [Linum perenne]